MKKKTIALINPEHQMKTVLSEILRVTLEPEFDP